MYFSFWVEHCEKNVLVVNSFDFWCGNVIFFFFYLYANFLCLWWGHFYLLDGKWHTRLPEYGCSAPNNLGNRTWRQKGKLLRPRRWRIPILIIIRRFSPVLHSSQKKKSLLKYMLYVASKYQFSFSRGTSFCIQVIFTILLFT